MKYAFQSDYMHMQSIGDFGTPNVNGIVTLLINEVSSPQF